jgi:hypothetical protein
LPEIEPNHALQAGLTDGARCPIVDLALQCPPRGGCAPLGGWGPAGQAPAGRREVERRGAYLTDDFHLASPAASDALFGKRSPHAIGFHRPQRYRPQRCGAASDCRRRRSNHLCAVAKATSRICSRLARARDGGWASKCRTLRAVWR